MNSKLPITLLTLCGTAILSSCLDQPSLITNHTSSSGTANHISSSNPSITTTTSFSYPTNNPTTITTSSTNENNSTNTFSTGLTALVNDYEAMIENSLKERINNRLERDFVSNFDAKYFALSFSSIYGKNLEIFGNVTLTTNENVSAMVAIPISNQEYQLFSEFNFHQNFDVNKDLKENYDDNVLSLVFETVSFGNNVAYGTLDGVEWNLDREIENNLEAKYTNQIYNYFFENYNDQSLDRIDLRYAKVEEVSVYGRVLELCGYTISKQDIVLPLTITLGVSDINYTNLSKLPLNVYDESKDLSDNYTKEQLNMIYQVDSDNSTIIYEYSVGSAPYILTNPQKAIYLTTRMWG